MTRASASGAAGFELETKLPDWTAEANGFSLPFQRYLFRDRGRPVHVFHAVVEDDGTPSAANKDFSLRTSSPTSFAPTWDELGRLAVVAVVRTFLSYFLDREMEHAGRLRTAGPADTRPLASPRCD